MGSGDVKYSPTGKNYEDLKKEIEQLKTMILHDIVADQFKQAIGGILTDACSAHAAVEFENQIIKRRLKVENLY